MSGHSTLRIGKCWQTDDNHLVLAVDRTDADGSRRKCYLDFSTESGRPAVSLSEEKPAVPPTAKSFAALFRKHVPSGLLHKMLSDSRGEEWLIPIYRGPPSSDAPYLLYIEATKPRILHLIDASSGESLARLSGRATYTKRKLVGAERLKPLWLLPDATARVVGEHGIAAKKPTAQGTGTHAFSERQRDLTRKLVRRRKTVRQALLKTEAKTAKNSALAELTADIEWMSAHLHEIASGSEHLIIRDDRSGNMRQLTLDPSISPGEALSQKHQERKRMLRSQTLGKSRQEEIQRELAEMDRAISDLRAAPSDGSSLDKIAVRFGLQTLKQRHKKPEPQRSHALRFLTKDGFEVWVGKSADDNDALFRMAKGHDIWLHVVTMTGSHVWLPSLKRQRPSDAAIREAAVLAVHYSKQRETRAAEVYVSQRAHLRRGKNLRPGQVKIDRAETIQVRYDEDELSDVLSRAGLEKESDKT